MTRLVKVLAVIGGAFAGGVASELLMHPRQPVAAQSPLPPPPATVPLDPPADLPRPTPPAAAPDSFDTAIRKVGPCVVSVDALKPPTQPAAGSRSAKPTEESGSGVLTKFDGYAGRFVVTNNHVVGGALAREITVTLADGRIKQPDRVLVDPESDVALLRIAGDDLPAAALGDSDTARVGQWVLAFGSPFGLNQTVTHGIISARERGQIALGNTIRIKEFLQTDAAINPGSSGGPLCDLAGNVVGINTAIASNNGNNSGVSFSIPANLIKRVGRQLLEKGRVSRGYLGLQLSPTLEPATALRLGLDRVNGALVESVHPGGPAAAAGLQSGDVILRVDGVEIRDENHLINLISVLPAGHRSQLTVWRGRRPMAAEAVVAEWSAGR